MVLRALHKAAPGPLLSRSVRMGPQTGGPTSPLETAVYTHFSLSCELLGWLALQPELLVNVVFLGHISFACRLFGGPNMSIWVLLAIVLQGQANMPDASS